jgi:enoyl-[acyl-carrier protein] reductase I
VILVGKQLLVTGVLTKDSIAFAAAKQAQLAGAEVMLTSFGRARRITQRTARHLPHPVEILELDAQREEDYDALAQSVDSRWGGLDGVLHAIAFAPADAINGSFLDTPAGSAEAAFRISAFSLKALTASLRPLLAARRGSVVGLDFDGSVAWPVYDWMGVSKAALEATSRYLARYVGPEGVRVNLISAGPVATVAATAIPGFQETARMWRAQAPLGWDVGDPAPVAKAICFLLSDWSEGITGEIVHVDGGFHAMGGPLAERVSELATATTAGVAAANREAAHVV